MPPWGTSKKSLFSPDYDRFLEVLRAVRLEAGLTQAQLAKRTGRLVSYISKSELGERRMDVVEFLDFCKGCRVDPDEVFRRVQAAIKKKR